MAANKDHQEHPLANILVNVLIPVLALSYLSKDPEFQRAIGKAVQQRYQLFVFRLRQALFRRRLR